MNSGHKQSTEKQCTSLAAKCFGTNLNCSHLSSHQSPCELLQILCEALGLASQSPARLEDFDSVAPAGHSLVIRVDDWSAQLQTQLVTAVFGLQDFEL